MTKRFFDILISIVGLTLFLPFFLIICILVAIESKGGVFYCQTRAGKDGKGFKLLKFRTMKTGSDKKGLLTIGNDDTRITQIGSFLRKYKLDETPQLFNVLCGDMSLVGPRPEVQKYVELYTDEQRKILTVKPGITDYASIFYINENELLTHNSDPEQLYIQVIMVDKIKLNMEYIQNPSLKNYFKILWLTLTHIATHYNRDKKRVGYYS